MANFSKNVTKLKIAVVAMVLSVVCSAVLIGRLFYLQIIDGDYYKQMALNQQLKDTIIEPHRGSIYDTNMKTMATSKTVWDVVFEPANLSSNAETREEELQVLCNPETGLPSLIDTDEATIRERAENTGSYWEVLEYGVEKETADAIELFMQENNVNCITLSQGTQRVYPFDDLAASVLGFVNSYDNRGAYGLESYYNKILTGTEGRIVSAKNGQNGEMPFQYEKLYESQDGNSLVLTIDEVIQHFVEKHLEIAVSEHEVKERAFGIVMDVNTGEILAMASKPDFDPNNPRQLTDKQAVIRLEEEIQKKRESSIGTTAQTEQTQNQEGVNQSGATENTEETAETDTQTVPTSTQPEEELELSDITANDLLTENLRARALNGGLTEEEFSDWLLDEQNRQWRNKVISDPYEPGSVFKIITASAALDTGSVPMDVPLFYCMGYKEVAGNRIHCWKRTNGGHGLQTLADAIKHSCNPAFIEIGQQTGAENFTTYFDRFGLGDLTGIDLPGEADNEGMYYTLDDMGIAELSSSSFGQTFKVSGIQLITALSAALNGGDLMQPYIVKQIIDSDHNIVETTEPTVRRQVISEETSAKICYMGEQVVSGGSDATGRNAAIPGYRIGGKTGTSEKLDNFDEDGNQYGNVLSFLGFAPADDPQIAILVALDEPVVGDAQSSTIAAPVVGAMLEDILPYLGYEPSFTEEEEAEQGDVTVGTYVTAKPHEAQAQIRAAGLKTEIVGQGVSVIKQVPEPGKTLPYGGTVILYTDESEANSNGTVPDVVGRSVSDANQLITNAGFNINIVGSVPDGEEEIIVTQEPPAGSSAEIGSIVTVNIDPDALQQQEEAEQAEQTGEAEQTSEQTQ